MLATLALLLLESDPLDCPDISVGYFSTSGQCVAGFGLTAGASQTAANDAMAALLASLPGVSNCPEPDCIPLVVDGVCVQQVNVRPAGIELYVTTPTIGGWVTTFCLKAEAGFRIECTCVLVDPDPI